MKKTDLMKGARRWPRAAMLALLMTGCAGTTVPGSDAGCASYAEARLARPAAATVAEVPRAWAGWIADLDDSMTGTCR